MSRDMHHIPETSHREPIYRTLPRLSVGLSRHEQPAIATKGPPHSPAGTAYGTIRVGRAVLAKAGQGAINRLSMRIRVYDAQFLTRQMNELDAIELASGSLLLSHVVT